MGMIHPFAGAAENHAIRSEILKGVSSIAVPGLPGDVCAFGPDALVLVAGGAPQSQRPVAVAGKATQGRAILLGHEGYLQPATLAERDTGRFVRQSLSWLATREFSKASIGIWKDHPIALWLHEQGQKPRTIRDIRSLNEVDVLILNQTRLSDEEILGIRNWMESGKGLLTCGVGWGWKQLNPGSNLATQHPANRLLIPHGMAVGNLTVAPEQKGFYPCPTNLSPWLHAGHGLKGALAIAGGSAGIPRPELPLASANLLSTLNALPPDEPTFALPIRSFASASSKPAHPVAEKPIRPFQLIERIHCILEGNAYRDHPLAPSPAHPAAQDFPGTVPPSAAVQIQSRSISLESTGWLSTGLYAPPGATIQMRAGNAPIQGLKIRIGAHQDRLWHKDDWQRFPEISWNRPWNGTPETICNPFGGAIYVENAESRPGLLLELVIDGAVEAPWFRLGTTSLKEWNQVQKNHPAPWAELQGKRVILSLPSEVVRDMENPEELMRIWDRILDLDAELAGIPRERIRPERVVCDRQISAGYMHAGYPIMTWMDQIRNFASSAEILKGNWGIFHEFGHNHQQPAWTFDGTGEVTCNLFTLYVMEKLCGIPPTEHPRTNAEAIRAQWLKHYGKGPDWNVWKSQPFLALAMYAQLQAEFGWEPFQKIFKEYRELPDQGRNMSQQERMDQWCVRFGKETGRNLAPFFQAWGMPLSPSAIQAHHGLPTWMPPGFPFQ